MPTMACLVSQARSLTVSIGLQYCYYGATAEMSTVGCAILQTSQRGAHPWAQAPFQDIDQ
jgi:hypothetical protein